MGKQRRLLDEYRFVAGFSSRQSEIQGIIMRRPVSLGFSGSRGSKKNGSGRMCVCGHTSKPLRQESCHADAGSVLSGDVRSIPGIRMVRESPVRRSVGTVKREKLSLAATTIPFYTNTIPVHHVGRKCRAMTIQGCSKRIDSCDWHTVKTLEKEYMQEQPATNPTWQRQGNRDRLKYLCERVTYTGIVW